MYIQNLTNDGNILMEVILGRQMFAIERLAVSKT